jgi:hypothetical protein
VTTNIFRGPLTDTLLEALQVVGKPVGDGQRPTGAGWVGQPNAPGSVYTPFLVLSAGTSTRSSGSIGAPQSEWQLNYLLATFGVERAQCDWIADRARDALGALRGTNVQLGANSHRIQQVWTQSIGGITPSHATDPPIWSQQDQLVIWLSKETS